MPGAGDVTTPTSPTEEKKKGGLWSKKLAMNFPGTKKLGRTSTEVQKPVVAPEEKSDTASFKSTDKEEKLVEDNFFGVIQKIRQDYEDHLEARPSEPLPQGIVPGLAMETPLLREMPSHTTVIIQEDDPASGGLADQYRGEISQLGNPTEVDVLEKIAPMWLGELLLKVSQDPVAAFLVLLWKNAEEVAKLTITIEPNPLQRKCQSLLRPPALRQSPSQHRQSRRQRPPECKPDAPGQENPGLRR
jgi:WD repeat-containing protein 48